MQANLLTMKISCDKCGAAFDAADDQELCAACRAAVAIGDRYEATPAVITAASGPADSAPPRIPPPEEYPNLWGIRSLRRVVSEAFRLWRASLPAMLGLGLTAAIINLGPGTVWVLAAGGSASGLGDAVWPGVFGVFSVLWWIMVDLPGTMWITVLIVLVAAETAARGKPPPLRAAIGNAWAKFGRALGAVVVFNFAIVAIRATAGAASLLVTEDPAGFWDASLTSSAEQESVGRLIADWAPLVPIAFLTVLWELSACTAVFERARPLRALRRSAVLVKQLWLPSAAIIGLAYAIMRFPVFVIQNATSLGTLSMEITRVSWNTIAFGFCNVLMFALYAALRDRELDGRALEKRDPSPTPP